MKTYTTQNNKRILRQAAVIAFWIGLWQLLAMAVDNTLLLPSVDETLSTLFNLLGEGEFYVNIGWTFFRCVLSMVISFVTGMTAAWLAYRKDFLRSFFTLPVGFFKAVPVMAIVIYVILLVESDWVAVIVCFLMCFPIVYTNVLSGLDAMDSKLLEVAYIYRLSVTQKIKYFYLPCIMPQIKAAVRLIAGLSWKAVVAAEVLSIPKYSLGYEMIIAKNYLQTSTLFSYIIVIVALSLVMEKLIDIILKRWNYKGYEGSKVLKSVTKTQRKAARKSHGEDVAVTDLSKRFGENTVFRGLNMTFEKDLVNCIVGPSGQGKTTLLRIIAGLEDADVGRITGNESSVSYLFQEDRLLPWLNTFDNMALSVINEGNAAKEGVKRMAEVLEISDALWKLPEELSGGMRHRAALGRTFLADAGLVLLDEPFRGLDIELKNRIIDRIWKKATNHKTVIMVTHSQEDAKELGDRVIELTDVV